MISKERDASFQAALQRLSALPLPTSTLVMSRETYVETLRYAGVPEDEIERRVSALQEPTAPKPETTDDQPR